MQDFIGTPYFMAPEVLSNNVNSFYDEKCDVWSLGLCFYYMLFGKLPFSDSQN